MIELTPSTDAGENHIAQWAARGDLVSNARPPEVPGQALATCCLYSALRTDSRKTKTCFNMASTNVRLPCGAQHSVVQNMHHVASRKTEVLVSSAMYLSTFSIVLEAPTLKNSFGDKASLSVMNIYSEKQQLCNDMISHQERRVPLCGGSVRQGVPDFRGVVSKSSLVLSIHICMCMYIYIYIYTYIYIYIYIYIYVFIVSRTARMKVAECLRPPHPSSRVLSHLHLCTHLLTSRLDKLRDDSGPRNLL